MSVKEFIATVLAVITVGLILIVMILTISAALAGEQEGSLNVAVIVEAQPVTIDAGWISQSPDTHWPSNALDVRMERVRDDRLLDIAIDGYTVGGGREFIRVTVTF